MEKETITLLVDGKCAFPEIIRCIEQARESVEINMFIWRDDKIGNRMAEAVLDAANRGVKVKLSVDRYGVVLEKCEESKKSFFHKKQTLTEKMKIKALQWIYPENTTPGYGHDAYSTLYAQIVNHPNITLSADVFKADHSKYYIMDEEILFLGGVNIEDKENGCDLRGRAYGDYMVKLWGREYVAALREKLRTGKNTLDGIYYGINRKKPTRRFEMERLYLDLINDAKTELHITMAYFSPIKKFTDAIIAAHKRGVRVTVVIPERANFQNDSNRRTVRRLLKATNGQIQVYLSPKMLHTKLIANDSSISLGSTNITKKAFSQLDEMNLFVSKQNMPFTDALSASIGDDINAARRVCRHEEIAYNPLMAWMESFLV